uniref:Uncharacterized protein n=1 Tax=Rhizophora mucronata TaxID=61149 RepID=A0A2P2P2J0_RHIMU
MSTSIIVSTSLSEIISYDKDCECLPRMGFDRSYQILSGSINPDRSSVNWPLNRTEFVKKIIAHLNRKTPG